VTLGFYIQKRRPLTVVPISMYSVHTFSHAHEELATCSVCARVVALVFCSYPQAVLGIRIRRIRMFFGLPDPEPDPLVRCKDADPDPTLLLIMHQNVTDPQHCPQACFTQVNSSSN
jgi:hypothetical protein